MSLDDFYDQVEDMNLRCDIRERVLTIVNDAHEAAYTEGHEDGARETWAEVKADLEADGPQHYIPF